MRDQLSQPSRAHIRLTGLPGSGKQRLKVALENEFSGIHVECIGLTDLPADKAGQVDQVWCVIDMRKPLLDKTAEAYLIALLQNAHRVVWSFVESTELTQQSVWQSWLTQQLAVMNLVLPKQRWFAGNVRFTDEAFAPLPAKQEMTFPILDGVQTMSLSLSEAKRVNLEHLCAGLDAAQHNLAMQIWRTKGVVMTQEYSHPVALEGTINAWHTFASTSQKIGWIEISGRALDTEFLKQIVAASEY